MRLHNIGWNLLGLVVPMLVALGAVVPLLQQLGEERFGLLALMWTVTAFSGILDLGLGRLTTRLSADRIGRGSINDVPSIIATASVLAAVFGLVGAAGLAMLVVADVHLLVNFDRGLNTEVAASAFLIALAFPAQAVISTYRGASEALQRYRAISIVRTMLGVANFGGPLLVAQVTDYLPALVAPIVLSRAVACWAYRAVLMRQLAEYSIPAGRWQWALARKLMGGSGWLTLSASISPLLAQSDRFVLASTVSATAVAAYALPYEIVMQPLVLVSAITTVAFPSLATMFATEKGQAEQTFRRWFLVTAIGMALVAGAIATLLPFVDTNLRVTLPDQAVPVGQILCLGMWLNALGQMYLAYVHARGQFRAVSLLYVVELPLYVILLMQLIPAYGARGAAVAWVARALFDTLGLLFLMRLDGKSIDRAIYS